METTVQASPVVTDLDAVAQLLDDTEVLEWCEEYLLCNAGRQRLAGLVESVFRLHPGLDEELAERQAVREDG